MQTYPNQCKHISNLGKPIHSYPKVNATLCSEEAIDGEGPFDDPFLSQPLSGLAAALQEHSSGGTRWRLIFWQI